jgi:hypothetical protein
MIIHVLTEGASDFPVIRELLSRHFALTEHDDFHIYPHRGRGVLPADIEEKANWKRRGLLDQLPAKLRGWGRYMQNESLVVVLIDADDDDPAVLLRDLNRMLATLSSRPPNVIFKLAVEETESWFIADPMAVKTAFPKANTGILNWILPDAVVGSWERLAECFGRKPEEITGGDKTYWAEKISPHLNFENPGSPSVLS